MIRGILSALSTKASPSLALRSYPDKTRPHSLISKPWLKQRNSNFCSLFSSLVGTTTSQSVTNFAKCMLLEPPQVSLQQIRTVTKFSLPKGKRKSVSAVPARFFRLHWGIWIRTRAGKDKKLWKKSAARKNRLSFHVFCNATQSKMLDIMVTKFWRKPKYYIEDPYEPYHRRENFPATARKPWRPEGVGYE